MSKYTDLLIQQYQKKPKARATIDLWCGEMDKVQANMVDLLNQVDIDQARGYSLDIIGRRVGIAREMPSYISKGFFSYYGADGKGWNKGVWYREGDSTNDTISLTDIDYRFIIKARILKNFQDGTLDSVLNALEKLMGSNVSVIDNYDMTASVYAPLSTLSPIQSYLIQKLDILPRPIGVKYNFFDIGTPYFGFNGFKGSLGFDLGSFIDA